jgi:hypothetical protein
MELQIDHDKIISKINYNFIIKYSFSKNDEDSNKSKIIQYELFIENHSNTNLVITVYEMTEDLTLTKYSNNIILDYFINQSPYIKCMSLISSTPYSIQNIFNLLKSKLEAEKRRNLYNYIYNKNQMNFRISKSTDKSGNLYLKFNIIYCNLKKEQLIIELNKIQSYSNENMPNTINELLEQNINMMTDIDNMEDDLKKLSKSKKESLTILKKCDAYYGQSIKMKMDFMDMGIDSDIFKSKDDYNFIIDNISKRVNRKIREIKQIFKASSNGDNINAFHDCCTYVQNMFVLILTDEKKCFGGFTRAEWNNNNKYKSDETAFIFSINNREIYPILNEYKKMAINCYDDIYTSVFGNDIYICDCFFSNNGNITQEGFYDYSNSKIKGDYKLTGKKYFSVSELEVYEIIFFE